jgi:hypothetical protein
MDSSEASDDEQPQQSPIASKKKDPECPEDDDFPDFDKQEDGEEEDEEENVQKPEAPPGKDGAAAQDTGSRAHAASHYHHLAEKTPGDTSDSDDDKDISPTLEEKSKPLTRIPAQANDAPAKSAASKGKADAPKSKAKGAKDADKKAHNNNGLWTPSEKEIESNEDAIPNDGHAFLVLNPSHNSKIIDLMASLQKTHTDIKFVGPRIVVASDFPHKDELKFESLHKKDDSMFIPNMPFQPPPELANNLVFHRDKPNSNNWKKVKEMVKDPSEGVNSWEIWQNLVMLTAKEKQTGNVVEYLFIRLDTFKLYDSCGLPIETIAKFISKEVQQAKTENAPVPMLLVDCTVNIPEIKAMVDKTAIYYLFPKMREFIKPQTVRKTSESETKRTRLYHSSAFEDLVVVCDVNEKPKSRSGQAQSKLPFQSKRGSNSEAEAAQTEPHQPSASAPEPAPEPAPAPAPAPEPPASTPADTATNTGALISTISTAAISDPSDSNDTAIVRRQTRVAVAKRSRSLLDTEDSDADDEEDRVDPRAWKIFKRMKPHVIHTVGDSFTLAFAVTGAQLHNTKHGVLFEGTVVDGD